MKDVDPLILCTDLDRTLIPNGSEPESPEARPLFSFLCALPHVTLVYVTGRDRGRVNNAMLEYDLPRPDWVVADVGTTIYDLTGNSDWHRNRSWEDMIGGYWNGLRQPDILSALSNKDDLAALTTQETNRQGPFKLSYTAPLDADIQLLDRALERHLETLGVDAHRIWSVDEKAQERLLDVVPVNADKLHALLFLRNLLASNLRQMVFAGDSGNDLAVLASRIPAVLVANARKEVAVAARRAASEADALDALYVARGDWHGMNGCYAAGILEGVNHFRPDAMAHLPLP